jgi:hypothetical protein
MHKIIISLIVIVALSTSCRKSYNCTCTTAQPGVDIVTTTENIDNFKNKANTICTNIGITIAGTATTTCAIQ